MAIEKVTNFEQIKKEGLDMQTIATEINNLLNRVSVEMEQIGGDAWQSANATQFKNNFDLLKQNFGKVYSAIDTMGQAINTSGKIYEAGEIGQ